MLDYGKVPPQAKELEDAVLGAIMLDKNAFDIVADILQPEVFYLEAHQRVFSVMKSLSQKNMPIDLLTVVEELKSREELDLVGGPFYITKLTNSVFSSANIEAHCRILFQKFIQREIIRVATGLVTDAYEDSIDVFDLLDTAEKSINGIGSRVEPGMTHISKIVTQTVEKIEEWRQIDGSITGIASGFNELDRATRGWQPGELIIIAARPSVGKTAFALNLIRNAAKKNVTVGVWSLEMKSVYLVLRMLASESKTFLYKLQTGRLTDEEMSSIVISAASKLSELNIFFEENPHITLQSLTRKARRLKNKSRLGMIVIDYVQLMSGDENKRNREREIAEISRGLKNLAQELDIPIIALSQLNRTEGERNVNWTNGPGLSAIRESGAIEQDADVVIMLWGPSDDDLAKDPTLAMRRKVRIVKQRNGVLKKIELSFKNEIQLFEKIEETINSNRLTTDFYVSNNKSEIEEEELF